MLMGISYYYEKPLPIDINEYDSFQEAENESENELENGSENELITKTNKEITRVNDNTNN